MLYAFILSFFLSFIHAFIPSFIHSFMLSFLHSFMLSFFHSFFHAFILSYSFILIHSFLLSFFIIDLVNRRKLFKMVSIIIIINYCRFAKLLQLPLFCTSLLNKSRFGNYSDIDRLISTRLSVENKARLSQLEVVNKQYCGEGVSSFQ